MISYTPSERLFSIEDAHRLWSECIYELKLDHELYKIETLDPSTYVSRLAEESLNFIFGTGKGVNNSVSQLSALYESLEHYISKKHCCFVSNENLMLSINELKEKNIPSKIHLAEFNFFYQMDNNKKITWIKFQNSKRTGDFCYMPLAIFDCHYLENSGYEDKLEDIDLYYYASNNGHAIGCSFEEAFLHGVNEIVERDSLSNYLISTYIKNNPVIIIDNTTLSHKLKKLVFDIEEHFGDKIIIYELPSSIKGFYSFGAQFLSTRDTIRSYVGYGCSAIPEYAIERAVLEAKQSIDVKFSIFQNDGCIDNEIKTDPVFSKFYFSNINDIIEEKKYIIKSFLEYDQKLDLSFFHLFDYTNNLLKNVDVYYRINRVFKNGVTHLTVYIPTSNDFSSTHYGYFYSYQE